MRSGSEELLESLTRLARAIGQAAAREAPSAQRAAGRIIRDDLPRWQRSAEKVVRSVLGDLGRRSQ